MTIETLLPWIIAIAAVAIIVGYVLGRRDAGLPSGPGTLPKRNPAPPAAANPVAASVPPVRPAAKPTAAPAGPSGQVGRSDMAKPSQGPEAGALARVTSWGYQLQKLNLKRAEASPFDLIVIDYAKDGTDDSALKPAEIERLKRKTDGSRRLVIAYLSIGEAESYRFYWQKNWKREKPAWLLRENPEWDENYAVCFWDQGWQDLFCGNASAYLDRIIAQGFDGIYLDKCDVVDDLREHEKQAARTRSDLDGDMVAFVCRLSSYAKSKKTGFVVIMQNAETLLDRRELREAIDASAKEELIYGVDGPEKANSRDEYEFSHERLELMRRDGKPVFVVEYLNNKAKIADAAEKIRKLGYVLYVSTKDRELDSLEFFVEEA